MAAYFNRKSEDVKKLNTAGFSNEEIAGILLITSYTHQSQKSVIEQMKDKTLEEIDGEAGIEAEEFQTIRGQALEELLKY